MQSKEVQRGMLEKHGELGQLSSMTTSKALWSSDMGESMQEGLWILSDAKPQFFASQRKTQGSSSMCHRVTPHILGPLSTHYALSHFPL